MTTTPNQTTREEISGERKETWSEVIAPLAAKFTTAWISGGDAIWNAKGSQAMAKLLTEMAHKLDNGDDHFVPRTALQSPTDTEADRLLREVRDWCATECQWADGTELMNWMERRDRIDAHLSRSIVGEGE